jgi:hypothetical protein
MSGTNKGIVLRLMYCLAVVGALLNSTAGSAHAETDLLVYPNKTVVFHYNPADYEEITASDTGFDPAYQVGGVSLWDRHNQRIAYEVFRAPALAGFQASGNGRNEFVLMVNEFNLIVDGFCDQPRQLGKLYVRFAADPPQTSPLIEVSGQEISFHIHGIPSINVQTLLPEGFYSDTFRLHIRWSAAVGIRITAYEDRNDNMVFGGGIPKWSVYVIDNTVPVERETWGSIKAMYDSD